jgi:DGQHR domain-containing protein
MTRIPAPPKRLSPSPEFPFISGRFAEGTPPVAYFLTAMRYSEARDSLRLVSELPGSSGVDWELEELYQRDVSWKRVVQRIVPYLKQRDRAQFFNALTIALLPLKNDRIVGMNSGGWDAPDFEHPDRFAHGKTCKFGPVSCAYYSPWQSPDDDGARLGCIRWNKDQVAAVAIDGQHRLAAIKEFYGSSSGLATSVPVILIVAHPALCGFGDSGAETIRLTRRLFIDLNKHSVKVSRARQILLDDFDPVSVCTRSLVGNRLSEGDGELQQGRLPLTLVDWHSEQAKFDVGPYLTTILGLDHAASVCVDVDPVIDPMKYSAWQDAIDRVRVKLGLELPEAERRLDMARSVDMPFEFTNDDDERGELAQIRRAFSDSWSKAIVHLFTALRPYAGLVERRRRDNTLTPDFASWWFAKSRSLTDGTGMATQALLAVERDLQNRLDPKCSPSFFAGCVRSYEAYKQESELAFTVAFQRGLLSAYHRFLSAPLPVSSDESEDYFGAAPEQEAVSDSIRLGVERQRRAGLFVEALNALFDRLPSLFDRNCEVKLKATRRLWSQSLLRDDGVIDFTGAASTAASDLLVCIAYLYVLQSDSDYSGEKFDELWEDVKDAESGDQLPLKLQQAVERMTKDSGFAGRIVKAMDPAPIDDDKAQKCRMEEVRIRLGAIWNALEQ